MPLAQRVTTRYLGATNCVVCGTRNRKRLFGGDSSVSCRRCGSTLNDGREVESDQPPESTAPSPVDAAVPAGTLAVGASTGELQIRFHVGNFVAQDHTNDYSFSATQTTLLDYTRVTLYNNGVLVWGVEPP